MSVIHFMEGINRGQAKPLINSNLTYTQSDYMFQLRNISSRAHSAFNVEVNFRPYQDGHKIFTTTPSPRVLKNQLLNVFYLQVDFPEQPVNIINEGITFSILKQEAQEMSQEIFMPRPKFNYCTTCSKDFDDYNQHIHSKEHHTKISLNLYSGYINDLVDKFNPQARPKPVQKLKRKIELKEMPIVQVEEIDSEDLLDGLSRNDSLLKTFLNE